MKHTARHMLIGLLLGLILTPGLALSPAPVQAQWLVFDQPQWLLKVQEIQQEIERWQATIEHYSKMYEKAVQQVTSLGGILKAADQLVSRNKDLVSDIAAIGKAVRDIYQLKRQIESMIVCKIRSVKSIESRLRAGILNPQQDLADLEEYLRDSIGRSSQDTVANIERLANADNEFERMRYELQLAYARKAEAEAALKEFEKMLDEEMKKPEEQRYNLGVLQTQIATTKVQIEQITTLINDLTAKLAEKMKQYGIKLTVRSDYGQWLHDTTKAWESTVPIRQDILKTIDDEFAQDPGIDNDPADGP
jgi:chromosome segregation ATPase